MRGLVEIFDAEHDGGGFHDRELGDFFEGNGDGAVGGVVEHEDEGDAFALVAFGLNDGRDADFGVAENGGNLRQSAGHVYDVEADEVARKNFGDRGHCAVALVRYKRRDAMFGGELEIKGGVGEIAEHRAGGGVLARAAAVEKGIANDVAAHEDGVEDMADAGQDVRVGDESRIDGNLDTAQGFTIYD